MTNEKGKSGISENRGCLTKSKQERQPKGVKTVLSLYLATLTLFFIAPIAYFVSWGYNEVSTIKEVRSHLVQSQTQKTDGNQLTALESQSQGKDTTGIKTSVSSDTNTTHYGGVGFTNGDTDSEFLKDLSNLDRINFLLMGIDSREDDLEGRTDTLMVFSFDQASGVVDLLSIPRDAYVDIAGKGKSDKINHAYSYGGSEMTLETVENLLDIEFDHYGVFNFQSFMTVVDKLGGIEVDVPFAFTEQDSLGRKGKIVFTEGTHELTGEEALAYARMRKQDPEGDVGRGKRQQQVIQATIEKLKTTNSISTYLDLFYTVKDSVKTDIRISDIPTLSTSLLTIEDFNTLTVTGENMYIKNIYYMDLNDRQLRDAKERLNTVGVQKPTSEDSKLGVDETKQETETNLQQPQSLNGAKPIQH